ncbi:MAG TPA: TonB family protein [Pyrinomonadaceae bacterium]|nr:TonB family protein [Pyrinomonadaceae bacterium]
MKPALYIILFLLASSSLNQAQTANMQPQQSNVAEQGSTADRQREVRAELDEMTRAYNEGHFAEAEQHARRALEIDPNNRLAKFALARTIHAQYRLGVDTDANRVKAHEAIEAYKMFLQGEPNNDAAYMSVAQLYGSLNELEQRREWILQRALNSTMPAKKRAQAYTVLASFDWNCSYDITDQRAVKRSITQPNGQTVIHYLMPENRSDFDTAKRCQAHGMEMIEAAIALDPEIEQAWAYKSNLLIEMAKAAEMEGNAQLKADLMGQLGEALRRSTELHEARSRETDERGADTNDDLLPMTTEMELSTLVAPVPITQDAEEEPLPPQPRPPTNRPRAPISGGVLNSKAISLPKPKYPNHARIAEGYWNVIVQVVVDEQGNVIKAYAVSGLRLLQPAAVAAARQAKFAPTRLSGQPVKVTGVIVYHFEP